MIVRLTKRRTQHRDRSSPLVCFATQSGGTTIDQDRYGGNPFATALIEASVQPDFGLSNLRARVSALTVRRSNRQQIPEWLGRLPRRKWRWNLEPGSGKERREALLLVVSEYSGRHGVNSLAGAALDERRIAAMLARCGFSVLQGVGSRRRDLIGALMEFERRSRRCDAAILYSTGHGLEKDGEVFLLPGDYPFSRGFGATLLERRAVPVRRMAEALRAGSVNLVFFAGCREYPTTRRSGNAGTR